MSIQERKRERRRRDKLRMKSRSIHIARIQNAMMFWSEDEKYNASRFNLIKRAIKHCDYIAVCSCVQCGNPRRKMRGQSNLTLQEQRFSQKDKY